MFWQKYTDLCGKNGIKPRALASELGAAPATVTRWKNGSIPNRETLEKIAERFNVTADYLVSSEDYDNALDEKRNPILKLKSSHQRKISLHRCEKITNKQLFEIAEYVNASSYYLNSEKNVEYKPDNETYDKSVLVNIDILFKLLNFMDGCPDTDESVTVQIQLSRIVLYHLANKGFTQDVIKEWGRLSTDKLNFLYTGKENLDPTLNFGLNFSDLNVIYDITGLSYQYMFTGIEDSYADIVKLYG